jgi:hypothetical protein
VNRKTWIAVFAFPALLSAQGTGEDGWNEAAGVNLSADEGFGARHSGMSLTFAGFQTDANAVTNAPAGMNDVDDFTFSTAHSERFGEAKFDDVALLVPLDPRSTLGIGLSRYGVSDIERYPEGVNPLVSQPTGHFSVADYLVAASFARATLHLLYRRLDQDGFGMRADAMAQYTWDDFLRVSALVKGAIPSAATWESGYSEYESPDIHLGISFRRPAPYFYGTLQAGYQTEGLLQKRAKSIGDDFGERFFSDPAATLQAGNLGLEFLFDFGVAVRFGLAEIGMGGGTLSAATFGVGYAWKNILGLDYSFAPHPDLQSSHRISLQFTPAFPRFDGRRFRTGGKAPERAPAPPAETAPGHEEGLEEGGSPELEEPASAVPAPAAPAPAAAPAAPAPVAAPARTAPNPSSSPAPAPSAAVPASPAPPMAKPASKAATSPAPAGGEVLEEEVEDSE